MRKFPLWAVVPYLIAQFAGAILASLALWLVFGDDARLAPLLLGITAPGPAGPWIVFFTEVVLGFLLIAVVITTATDEWAIPTGIGLAIAAGVIVALNVSGGSFNATLGGGLGALCYDLLTRSGAPPE